MRKLLNSKGQIAVEYILLVVIAVAVASVLVSGLVSRGEEPGIIIRAWHSIVNVISDDYPDEPN